jgi:hypothetical protein
VQATCSRCGHQEGVDEAGEAQCGLGRLGALRSGIQLYMAGQRILVFSVVPNLDSGTVGIVGVGRWWW